MASTESKTTKEAPAPAPKKEAPAPAPVITAEIQARYASHKLEAKKIHSKLNEELEKHGISEWVWDLRGEKLKIIITSEKSKYEFPPWVPPYELEPPATFFGKAVVQTLREEEVGDMTVKRIDGCTKTTKLLLWTQTAYEVSVSAVVGFFPYYSPLYHPEEPRAMQMGFLVPVHEQRSGTFTYEGGTLDFHASKVRSSPLADMALIPIPDMKKCPAWSRHLKFQKRVEAKSMGQHLRPDSVCAVLLTPESKDEKEPCLVFVQYSDKGAKRVKGKLFAPLPIFFQPGEGQKILPGDSGSPVFDQEGKELIGFVMGGTEKTIIVCLWYDVEALFQDYQLVWDPETELSQS